MNRNGAWLTIAALCGAVPIAYAQLTSGVETIPCPLAFETSSVGGSGTVPAANAYQNLGNNPGIASNPPLTSPLGITPGVGLNSNGIAQSSGYNPGVTC